MRITQLEIKNFRNITEKVYAFENNPVILAGKNGLGKSNSLNALMWMLAGTLLTDNYGVGENDIDSIVPNNHEKGMHTEVSITFESGAKFTKRYKTSFSRKENKVNGHNTEWLINDVLQKNEGVFLDEFYKQLKYHPCFKNFSANELNLFIDPLYALQKLEPKQLRELLVGLGCSVSNQELYNEGFKDIQVYESKYLGKWDVMRADLKKNIKSYEKEISDLKVKLETVAGVEEFKESALKELNLKKESLINQKTALKSGTNSSVVKDIEIQIRELQVQKDAAIQKEISAIDADIKVLKEQKRLEEERLATEEINRTKNIDLEIGNLQIKISNVSNNISIYEMHLSNFKSTIESSFAAYKNAKDEKNNLAIKLNAVISRTYNNYLTCPHCGKNFPFSEEDVENFNKQKEEEKQAIKDRIVSITNRIEQLRKDIETADVNCDKTKIELDSLKAQKVALENELLEKQNQRANINSIPIDRSSLEIYDNQIASKNSQKLNVASKLVDYDKKINELAFKKDVVISQNSEKISEEIRVIEDTLGELEENISNAHVLKSKWEDKKDYISKLEANVKALNDTEALYARVDKFIKTMISKINQKATAKTGIDFVMLEENISNEGIKEVCYATLNGIPFKDVNTAEKLKAGVRFIERLKDICVNEFGIERNTLPILADRLEGIDDLDKIRNLTSEQFICTRVSLEDTITILN